MTEDGKDQRDPRRPDRHQSQRGGRRMVDRPSGNAWTPGQLAYQIGMSAGFVLSEIRAKELVASQFGREYRIAAAEVRRYMQAKGFPLPKILLEQLERSAYTP